MSNVNDLREQFIHGLSRLRDEVMGFPDEKLLWERRGDIRNTSGNLSLHLAGNISHFIGAVLGKTGYVRNREREFAATGVERAKLLEEIDAAGAALESVFSEMEDSRLADVFPLDTFGAGRSTGQVLLILLAHLNYHLGQINYLRRMMKEEN